MSTDDDATSTTKKIKEKNIESEKTDHEVKKKAPNFFFFFTNKQKILEQILWRWKTLVSREVLFLKI